jgi:hypothetical protein
MLPLPGGLLQALQGVESFLQTSQSLPLNVKFILEGQEEIGSPNLEAFLRKHKGGLLAEVDMAISADGGQIAADQPGKGLWPLLHLNIRKYGSRLLKHTACVSQTLKGHRFAVQPESLELAACAALLRC